MLTEKQKFIDIYVAGPYSNNLNIVRNWRYKEITHYAAHLVKAGYVVYSPITQSHPMVLECPELGTDWAFWQKYDEVYIPLCKELHILMLPHWDVSVGVAAEIIEFEKLEKCVTKVKWVENHEYQIEQKGE